MSKINLLHVITKLELGGAQKQLLSLITYLDKENYSLSLITAENGLLVENALSVKDLRIKRSRFLERPINPLKDLLAFCEIRGFIKENKIDIVHTHSSKAGILARWAGRFGGAKIIVHTVHGWSFNDYQNRLFRKIIIWLEQLTALITDKLIVVSEHDKQKGLDNHIGSENKYGFVRYGIDYKQFNNRDRSLREEFGVDDHSLLVGTISCFKPQKSPQDFLKLAFLINKSLSQTDSNRKNPLNKIESTNRVKFILVGDGVLRREVEGLTSKFNLQQSLILAGWREDIPQILSAMDIFVLTSLWEGLPISVLEAMVTSLPVIATNTGGISEVILEGKTGFLVSPRNINKMAEKVNELLKNKALRKQIGQSANVSLGRNFTIENMVRNTENLYCDLVAKQLHRHDD
jgi:glycosyltransferase involved in cell wall biosynthesis